ncbi:MAG: RNA polymerase subunit sigma-70 [Acidobacteria bacterium]|nr:MAG: RNA polymerase subunit sigma-70 [Acidobacteriota bacterium]
MDAVITWFGNPMEQESARFVKGLHRGDPEILDDLIEIYQHRLLRYLLSLTGSRPMAEDIFQETWLRVLERGRQYRSQWRFDVWLFSIARHLVIDEARRKRGLSLDELMDSEAGMGFEPLARGLSPFEEVVAGQEGERVMRVLSRIPAVYREVLILRFHDELPLDDIVAIINVPLSTVKSRLYRGLEAVRKTMGPEQS